MEALVCVVSQQRPGDAVVWRVMQQDTLSWLIRSRTWAQDATTSEPKSELKVPVDSQSKKETIRPVVRTDSVGQEIRC